MKHRYHAGLRATALVSLLVLIGAACSSSKPGTGNVTGKVEKGGTFRIEADEFPWESSGNGFDPVAEYVGTDWTILKNLLLRSLMGYRHTSADRGGDEVLPDLATGKGVVSADGLTWTYTLKEGVKFGPPLTRAVTSRDVAYAFERMATPALDSGGYQGYFRELLVGFEDFEKGKAKSISGISTPNDQTIAFTLKTKSADWDYRMAMPSTAPVPEEVGRCFKKALEYGQFIVSTGPYAIEGMDKLDISDCDFKKKAPSGFDFDKFLYLVRNPNYDEATDSKEMREPYPDRFEFKKNTNVNDIFEKIEKDQVDWTMSSPPGDVLSKYSGDEALKKNLKSGFSENATWYITMNLALPPFDDVHVRKAASFIMDKSGIQKVVGGRVRGAIAEHIVPPSLLGGQLKPGEFNPYASPNNAGDLEKAKAEMKLSKYDKNQDGICDAAACSAIRHVTRNTEPFPDLALVVNNSLAKIGLKVDDPVEAASYYGEIGVPAKKIHLGSGGGWGPDWPEALTFFLVPLTGKNIGPAGNINTGLLGMTKEQAASFKITYPAGGIPSIDAKVDACSALAPGADRITCWVNLDKEIMNDYVPWIPYRWAESADIVSNAVTKTDFDQFGSEFSLAHTAIDPDKQK